MKLTLVRTPGRGELQPDLVIFCNQGRLLVVGLGHQPSHNASDPQPILTVRQVTATTVAQIL